MNKKLLIGGIIIFVIAFAAAGYFLFGHQSTEKPFSGINIIFFPGGSQTDPFASVVYNGAKAAQENLGANVKYMWSNWDTDTMVSQFKEAISEKPDAICIMGHPGEEILGPLVDEAERAGIIVTIQNVDLPNIRAEYTSQGMGYVGQELYQSGFLLSTGAIREFNLKSGDEVLVFGLLSEAGRGERTRGCIDGLNESGIKVDYEEITNDVNANPATPAGQQFVADALSKHPHAKAIIIDHGSFTAAISQILKALGKNPGDILIAGFDLSQTTVQGITGGYIGLVSDQQPFLQGYLPILQACLTKKYGFAGLDINTGVGLIDKSNVDLVSKLADEKIR